MGNDPLMRWPLMRQIRFPFCGPSQMPTRSNLIVEGLVAIISDCHLLFGVAFIGATAPYLRRI
jgi:hypothetical protein